MDWTQENMRWFLDQPAPRQVDETLMNEAYNVLMPKMARVLLYILPLVMLTTMGMALALMVTTANLEGEWRLLTEPTALAPGKVLETQMRKGSKGSITYVYTFEFRPSGQGEVDAPPVRGVSFSSTQATSTGKTVSIEYLPDDPRISRIKGCRLNAMSVAVLAALPVVGGIAVILPIGILRYKRKWLQRLLSSGIAVPATIEKLKAGPKGALIVQLLYTVGGIEVKSKTNVANLRREKEWLQSTFDAGRSVTLLVDPEKPKNVFLLDLLLK